MPHAPATAGSLFMVVAPSGAGKSSLVNALLEREPAIKLSISYTTRQPRPGEQHGREYFFTSADDFLVKRDAGEFLESAEVHGNYYGTSRIQIAEQMKAGTDILLEIDWQGAQQVKKQFPQATGIFILPPSIAALEERLHKRGQDEPHVITRRILAAGGEIAHAPESEYVIINQDFATALSELTAIIKAARCRFAQQAARNASLFTQLGIHANLT
ncbi:guanylate kinase [Janthinobacterium sp. 17J80-10]|uniref:guanylate kinase n=1 Tax=Janthinobacterium sp. 17J80-10 TaxID=2497863 RepID=UPI00100529E4|nr:guanylate kinase [Janthinobacterium sp. 17J80-10]QAU35004.1 guanylate kinase [Janthinobacterium sp. 17J80-10]